MKIMHAIRVTCVLLATLAANPSHANLILNGDFEANTPAFTSPVDSPASPDSWTPSGQALTWAEGGPHFGVVTVPDSGDSGTIVVNFGGPADVFQEFATVIGQEYAVSYDLGGFNATGGAIAADVGVFIDFDGLIGGAGDTNVANHTINVAAGPNASTAFSTFSLNFTATSTTTLLKIAGTNDAAGDDSGALLDNVSVVAVAAAAPEPSALMLCAISLVGLAAGRRSRQR